MKFSALVPAEYWRLITVVVVVNLGDVSDPRRAAIRGRRIQRHDAFGYVQVIGWLCRADSSGRLTEVATHT
jgi:hypothetical protein